MVPSRSLRRLALAGLMASSLVSIGCCPAQIALLVAGGQVIGAISSGFGRVRVVNVPVPTPTPTPTASTPADPTTTPPAPTPEVPPPAVPSPTELVKAPSVPPASDSEEGTGKPERDREQGLPDEDGEDRERQPRRRRRTRLPRIERIAEAEPGYLIAALTAIGSEVGEGLEGRPAKVWTHAVERASSQARQVEREALERIDREVDERLARLPGDARAARVQLELYRQCRRLAAVEETHAAVEAALEKTSAQVADLVARDRLTHTDGGEFERLRRQTLRRLEEARRRARSARESVERKLAEVSEEHDLPLPS